MCTHCNNDSANYHEHWTVPWNKASDLLAGSRQVWINRGQWPVICNDIPFLSNYIISFINLLRTRQKAQRIHRQLAEIFTLSDPSRPGPATVRSSEYLWNRAFDRQAVFFAACWVVPSITQNIWVKPIPLHISDLSSTTWRAPPEEV